MIRLFVISTLFVGLLAKSQEVMPYYNSGNNPLNWSLAGIPEGFGRAEPQVDFVDFMSDFPGDISHDDVMDELIQKYPDGAQVFFPNGEYRFKRQIRLPSNYLIEGESRDSTKFIFELDKDGDCILVQGKAGKKYFVVKDNLVWGENRIRVDNSIGIRKGMILYLQDNDDELVKSDWAKGKTGHFVRVVDIEGGKVILHEGVRREFKAENEPKLWRTDLAENVGIENLTIVNYTKTKWQSSNIQFRYAQECYVRNVYSFKCNYSHVLMEFASHCEVVDCEFRNAHSYGNGGQGYGVTLQFGTSRCLVRNNKFDHLRHSMLLQAGANGNVLIYNHSKNPYWTDVRLPEDSAGDIVFHGNYPYDNLVEKNHCQTLVMDNSHGKNGPRNYIFDNKVKGYGIVIHRKSKGQFVINNVVKEGKFPKGRYRVKGKQFEQFNKVGERIYPKKSTSFDDFKTFWN